LYKIKKLNHITKNRRTLKSATKVMCCRLVTLMVARNLCGHM